MITFLFSLITQFCNRIISTCNFFNSFSYLIYRRVFVIDVFFLDNKFIKDLLLFKIFNCFLSIWIRSFFVKESLFCFAVEFLFFKSKNDKTYLIDSILADNLLLLLIIFHGTMSVFVLSNILVLYSE